MFLSIAYLIFLAQVAAISLLILPIPIKLRRSVTDLVTSLFRNTYVRFGMMLLMFVMLGLFVENLLTVWRYADLKNEIGDVMNSAIGGKHEILMKLFRAERNAYLTFIINFNWLVLYGIQNFITAICRLESTRTMNDVIAQALATDTSDSQRSRTETLKEKRT